MDAVKWFTSAVLAVWLACSGAGAADFYFSNCKFDPALTAQQNRDQNNGFEYGDACDTFGINGGTASEACDVCPVGMAPQLCIEAELIAVPGTRENPWCLNPEGPAAGVRASFEHIMDAGAGTRLTAEAAAGDTIWLCDGACDGLPSVDPTLAYNIYFHLETHLGSGGLGTGCTDARLAIDYEVPGPITIRPYCNGEQCEKVVLSGDAANNLVWNSGVDASYIVGTADCDGGSPIAGGGHGNYTWLGDPNGDGDADLVLEKADVGHFYNVNTPTGTTNLYDGLEVRYQGAGLFQCSGDDCQNFGNGGVGMNTVWGGQYGCPQNDTGAYIVTRSWGTVTIQNGELHHLCYAGLRSNNNCNEDGGTSGTQLAGCTSGITALNLLNNEIWNGSTAYNSHQVRNINIIGNYVHDVYYGIGLEEHTFNAVVADNTVACLGEYDVNVNSNETVKCANAITVNDGDGGTAGCQDVPGQGSPGECLSDDIVIARNKVYESSPGRMVTGIQFRAHTTGAGGLGDTRVENNMVWAVSHGSGCTTSGVDSETGLGIDTSDPIIVRNNTVYRTRCPMTIEGAAHTVTGNLVHNTTGGVELLVTASAAGSTVNANNLYAPSGNVATINGVSYTCASFPSVGTGNLCGSDWFDVGADDSGIQANWRLHLDPTRGTCTSWDAAAAGTSTDIDSQPRPFPAGGAFDIGADEYTPFMSLEGPPILVVPPRPGVIPADPPVTEARPQLILTIPPRPASVPVPSGG